MVGEYHENHVIHPCRKMGNGQEQDKMNSGSIWNRWSWSEGISGGEKESQLDGAHTSHEREAMGCCIKIPVECPIGGIC